MTSKERVARTLKHEAVDRAPRELWSLPGVHMFQQEAYQRVIQQYPSDFAVPPYSYGPALRARGEGCVVGEYTDAWGCIWRVGEPGVVGEIKDPILKTVGDIESYLLPHELLDGMDLSRVDAFCVASQSFTKVGSETRPFERLQFLLGTEQAMMNLALGDEPTLGLLEKLHQFYCRELEMLANTALDGVSFMDDWGSQNSLLISPAMWRALFKPLYRDYCDILHAAGKFTFFHSDGNIEDIYPDLIEIGVDAVNSQLFCMDIERLGREYAGHITFWGEIDRQHVMTFGTPEDVRTAVRRVRTALDQGKGGVIAQCEWGNDTPEENVAAVYSEWLKP
ncbi:MAG: uroporphyrinogen decarboxylase family protein [Armatimonadota bacterium]